VLSIHAVVPIAY